MSRASDGATGPRAGDPRFVVTGCARSGTRYMADLLTEVGHPCAHESVFAPRADRFTGFRREQGESSWLAAPFVDQLPAGTVVLHQVRRPDFVVQSMLGIRFFAAEGSQTGRDARALLQVVRSRSASELVTAVRARATRGRRLRRDFVDFVRRYCDEAFAEPTEPARAARYWVAWNRLAARAEHLPDVSYLRYRIEDIGVPLVAELVEAVGGTPDPARIQSALARLPSTTNTRPFAAGPDRMADLPPGLAGEVAELAQHYGYEV